MSFRTLHARGPRGRRQEPDAPRASTDLCTLGLRPAPRAPGLSTSEVDIHVQGTPPAPHPSDRSARRDSLCHFRRVGGVAAALDPLRLERAPRLLDAASGGATDSPPPPTRGAEGGS